MIDGTAECVTEFESTAADREFKIEKNFEERWTYTGVPEWCSVKAEEGKIVLSVTENKTKEDRTATVEFRKKDGTEVLAKLMVNQIPKGAKGQQQVEEKVYGSVKISSIPSGASIWIDGKDTKKTTPEIIENLTVGSHKVVLKLSGYEDASGRTTVKENERAELTLTMISSHSNNGHEWVDLGLSVKWATCNVGATKPEEYGNYFAWGETSPKNSYYWENLKYWISGDYENGKFSKYVIESKYGTIDYKAILDQSDDAAHSNWGGSWRMPTHAEQDELRNKCTWTWSTQGNHNGYKVTSKINGNSIFLPAAGYRLYSRLEYEGSRGEYFSSSVLGTFAYSLRFYSNVVEYGVPQRCEGNRIRPVCP